MLNPQLLSRSDYKAMPWKNGLGQTLEIHRVEDNQGLRFRISQASVIENGAFSDFEGLQRCLVLLSGAGATLTHKNGDFYSINHLEKPLDMAHFAGADSTSAYLQNGAIEDLNIMVRMSDTEAKVTPLFAPTTVELTNTDRLFSGFYANTDSLIAYEVDDSELPLNLYISKNSMFVFTHEMQSLKNIQLLEGSGVSIEILAS